MQAKSSTFLDTLADIGRHTEFDAKRLSLATRRSIASHYNLLKRNEVDLSRPNILANAPKIIKSLRDSHGAPLKADYRRQIAISLQRMFPNDRLNIGEFMQKRVRQHATSRLASTDFVAKIARIVRHASEYVRAIDDAESIDDMAMYSTCLSILLTTGTSMHISELHDVKMPQLEQIVALEPIAVRTKRRTNRMRHVAANQMLLGVIRAIKRQRPKVHDTLVSDMNSHNALNRQRERLERNYVIISSESFMRKKLHEMSAAEGQQHTVLGFNAFRKFIVSVLSENGGHRVAQTINNHSRLDTTLDNYHVMTGSAAEKTYDKLHELLRHEANIGTGPATPKFETTSPNPASADSGAATSLRRATLDPRIATPSEQRSRNPRASGTAAARTAKTHEAHPTSLEHWPSTAAPYRLAHKTPGWRAKDAPIPTEADEIPDETLRHVRKKWTPVRNEELPESPEYVAAATAVLPEDYDEPMDLPTFDKHSKSTKYEPLTPASQAGDVNF